MSTTGYNSHYNDSGWSNTGFYGVGNSGNPSVGSNDIYYTTQQVGVYMINGSYTTSTTLFPIQTSTVNLTWIGIPGNVDDAYLVYPGYGFILYTGASYGGSASAAYVNNNLNPVIFYPGNNGSNGWSTCTGATPIYFADLINLYPLNSTVSIKIYFRGSQIITSGIS